MSESISIQIFSPLRLFERPDVERLFSVLEENPEVAQGTGVSRPLYATRIVGRAFGRTCRCVNRKGETERESFLQFDA